MTLADRIETAIRELGPLPVCVLAPTLRKQKAEVIAALNGNPDRFVHNGLKARASRWDVRRDFSNGGVHDRGHLDEPVVTWPHDYDAGEDALVESIRKGRRTPEEALLLVVRCVVVAA